MGLNLAYTYTSLHVEGMMCGAGMLATAVHYGIQGCYYPHVLYGPYTLVINVRGGASYFDILYHLFFIYIHKITILEVFIVGIAVDENYVKQQKALFTITTHFQRCLLMKRICQITTATSFYNIYTFSEVLAVELLFVRTQKL